MSTEVVTYQEPTGLPALTAEQVRARVNLVQQVMKGVMKSGTHYGIIPGTDKPSLWKPGAETLAVTFRLAIDPVISDLSTSDETHYRVECRALSQTDGTYLGSGIGEASSNEEKYKWRKSVCDAEFDETPEDRRRTKWAKGKGGSTYQVKQVRTQPADVANTVLKMAKKRAQVDMTLSVTGASDIFTQDIEDMPDELRSIIVGEESGTATASTIAGTCFGLLLAEMERVRISEVEVKKNLAAKAKYTGDLAGMPHVVWESLMAGLATMPTKTPKPPATVDPVTGELGDDDIGFTDEAPYPSGASPSAQGGVATSEDGTDGAVPGRGALFATDDPKRSAINSDKKALSEALAHVDGAAVKEYRQRFGGRGNSELTHGEAAEFKAWAVKEALA